MAMRAVDIRLDSLTAKLQQHAQPPPDFADDYCFISSIGPCQLSVHVQQADAAGSSGGREYHVSFSLRSQQAAPAAAGSAAAAAGDSSSRFSASLALTAVRSDQVITVAEVLAADIALHKPAPGEGLTSSPTWSGLREAIASCDHAQLHAKLVLLSQQQLPTNAALQILPAISSGWSRVPSSSMLNGPFADCTVRAGGKEFRAHRVVLATASPVLHSMLAGDMREAASAEIEVREADPEVVELMLMHVYGTPIEVRLSAACQLHGLADQYQIRSDLGQQLRLWLGTARLQAEAFCHLAHAMHKLCPAACTENLCNRQAGGLIEAAGELPAFLEWPLDTLTAAITVCPPLVGYGAAAAWMGSNGTEKRRPQALWGALLDAVAWSRASGADLRAMRKLPGSEQVPGLDMWLYDRMDALFGGLTEKHSDLEERHADLEGKHADLRVQHEQHTQQLIGLQATLQHQSAAFQGIKAATVCCTCASRTNDIMRRFGIPQL